MWPALFSGEFVIPPCFSLASLDGSVRIRKAEQSRSSLRLRALLRRLFMGTFGKVLAGLNVVVAIGFVCFAALAFGRHQEWSFAVLQQKFQFNGLPVDENETEAASQMIEDPKPKPIVNLLTDRMMQQLFSGVPGSQVKTQVEEVKQRRQNLLNEIQNAGAATKEKLKATLLPLARTWGEREDLRTEIDKRPIDDLLGPDGPFEKAFAAALDGKTSEGKDLELGERRKAIAHLLLNTSTPSDVQRTLVIVGLEYFAAEADSQALALAGMMPRLTELIDSERTAFLLRHQSLVQQSVNLAERIADLDDSYRKQVIMREQHSALVKKRMEDVEELKMRIAEAKKALAEALTVQSGLEKELFENQQAVAATEQKNRELEGSIRARELGQGGGGR
jgi:hypothetical protein